MNTYHTTATVTYEAFKTMCWALMRRRKITIAAGIAFLFLIGVGIDAWVAGQYGIVLFVLILGVGYPLLLYLIVRANIRRVYRTTKAAQNLTVDYAFEPERVVVKTANGENRIRYEDFYKVIETPTHFYLMIGSNQAYIVVKANCDAALIAFLKGLREQIGPKKHSVGRSKTR
ncbi:YcxB family protein [Pseudoramibacter faecis]|uniref:YcxB family protein n=1 Tax=Pseudoramibacter faecis TaxID=3108534 RepID=UPI002E783197|nr:YcxB family protein [Pseudoramibacter sp. HA2172]